MNYLIKNIQNLTILVEIYNTKSINLGLKKHMKKHIMELKNNC